MVTTAELIDSDRRHLWHSFTAPRASREPEPLLLIDHADPRNHHDATVAEYIDALSSEHDVHGRGHPAIDAAIRDQLERVAHPVLHDPPNEPAIELARRLIAIAPVGLERVFYCDSGSSAVDLALKMVSQWWAQRGETERMRFIRLESADHGDPRKRASAQGSELVRSPDRRFVFERIQVRACDAADLEPVLAAIGDRVAGVIVEPLVQATAGMRLQPRGYLRRVRDLCDEHRVLLICDEVTTGFGRTGRMFACEHEQVTPDLLCVGDGLTSGYLPLAATITTELVYDGCLGGVDFQPFPPGRTLTANPLACAAGVATLQTLESERTLELLEPKIGLLSRLLEQRVAVLPGVTEVRQLGMMVGIELLAPIAPDHDPVRQAVLAARRRGAAIGSCGDVIVLTPALAITDDDLRRLVAITASSIAEAYVGRLPGARVTLRRA